MDLFSATVFCESLFRARMHVSFCPYFPSPSAVFFPAHSFRFFSMLRLVLLLSLIMLLCYPFFASPSAVFFPAHYFSGLRVYFSPVRGTGFSRKAAGLYMNVSGSSNTADFGLAKNKKKPGTSAFV